jgi:hypothetical protein
MSQVAVAPKAAKSAAASEAKTETLREAQPKRFHQGGFFYTGQDYEIMHITAGDDWTWDDVMTPVAWSGPSAKIAKNAFGNKDERKPGSTIFVHSPNFFGMLNIDGVIYDHMNNPCGLKLTCIGPATDLETGEMRPVDLKTRKALAAPKAAKAAA